MRRTVPAIVLLCCGGAAHAQETKSLADYRAAALATVESISVADSSELQQGGKLVFVDIRDSAELEDSGKVSGAVHIPRGMLEFYIDPASSLHNRLFRSDKKIVFYCETGGRSLLAAKLASDMGVRDVNFLEGGFRAWSKAGGETTQPD